ncbi:lipid-binding SYLF domain-containing protein [Desulfobacter vibrioformis]|uniref:lipid-binding SYLF domain-containing protein n=1 Tax=Desulfobacter vibrioformis TaxID=34031 RepID=UPI000A5CC87B|nr:lipid-binding SYLF domain-containing protein [Desulfobacter vibrioformis]
MKSMMKTQKFFIIMLAGLLSLFFTVPAFADSCTSAINVFKKATAVQPFFNNCYGYAVFPTVGKGGIFVGGAYGTGRVYQGGLITGTATIAKITVGFQLGGQAFSEIIFFQDKRAYDEFTNGSYEFDASVSAVVVTAGVQAKAGSDGGTAGASAGPATGIQAETGYYKGMAVFIHAKGGLMYEAAIGGQRFDVALFK